MLGLSDENGPKSDELIPTLLRIAQKYNLKVITLFNYYSKKYYLIKKKFIQNLSPFKLGLRQKLKVNFMQHNLH